MVLCGASTLTVFLEGSASRAFRPIHGTCFITPTSHTAQGYDNLVVMLADDESSERPTGPDSITGLLGRPSTSSPVVLHPRGDL